SKPVIEDGKDQHCNEPERREHHDDLLRRFFLRSGSHLHATLEQFRIVDCEVHGNRARCAYEHGHEEPRLPIIEGPGGNEEERRQRQDAEEGGPQCASGDIIHIAILSLLLRPWPHPQGEKPLILARSCEQDSRVVAGAKNRAGKTARRLTTSADEKLWRVPITDVRFWGEADIDRRMTDSDPGLASTPPNPKHYFVSP